MQVPTAPSGLPAYLSGFLSRSTCQACCVRLVEGLPPLSLARAAEPKHLLRFRLRRGSSFSATTSSRLSRRLPSSTAPRLPRSMSVAPSTDHAFALPSIALSCGLSLYLAASHTLRVCLADPPIVIDHCQHVFSSGPTCLAVLGCACEHHILCPMGPGASG
jgi:hypothetical protein